MRQKKVWRYYCEFCKKAGCHAGHMRKHELHCTANPSRKCRVCDMRDGLQEPTDVLIAALGISFKRLEEVADGCPACILTALRLAPENHGLRMKRVEACAFLEAYDEPIWDGRERFDYREQMKSVMSDVNESRRATYGYGDY